MNALDTNIWLYSHDTRDPSKQAIAQQLIATARPYILPWQVGCEFIAGSRKLAVFGFSPDQAWNALSDMQALADEVLLPDPNLWQAARGMQQCHGLSFWDALLVAACKQGSVTTLYTENMGAPRTIEGVFLVNPFVP